MNCWKTFKGTSFPPCESLCHLKKIETVFGSNFNKLFDHYVLRRWKVSRLMHPQQTKTL